MPKRRTPPRPMGRPRLIGDPDVEEALLGALRLGVPIGIACQAADIASRTYFGWMEKGHDEHEARGEGLEPDESMDAYLDLYLKVRKARAAAAVRNVGTIQKVAQGGTVVETTTERLPDGTVRETVKKQPPDWRAAAWYLERSHRSEYGKDAQQVEISGAGGGPIQMSVDAEDLSTRLSKHLAAGVAVLPALEGVPVEVDLVDDDDAGE